MCYSAEASFVAAGVVGLIGLCTLREVREPRAFVLGAIPALFALHQASEGVLWVFLGNQLDPNWLFHLAKVLYILIGFIAWPMYFSLSALLLEQVPWRRRVIQGSLALGIVVSLYFTYHFATGGIHPTIVGHSIHYDDTRRPEGLAYLAALSLPYLFSSVRYLWVIGLAAPLSFAISAYYYWVNFASVWCYFAALISCWLYVVIRSLPSHDQQSS